MFIPRFHIDSGILLNMKMIDNLVDQVFAYNGNDRYGSGQQHSKQVGEAPVHQFQWTDFIQEYGPAIGHLDPASFDGVDVVFSDN